MAKIVKQHSISSAPAQKVVDAAVAKAKEIGISENVAIPRLGTGLRRSRRSDEVEDVTTLFGCTKTMTAGL